MALGLLARASPDIQRLVVFDGGFERLFAILRWAGGGWMGPRGSLVGWALERGWPEGGGAGRAGGWVGWTGW